MVMEMLNLALLERMGKGTRFDEVKELVQEGFESWRSPRPSQL
jgi:hypothetical protein